ncbi:MAG: 16S rRNA (adenine(1518)-N(6)/adenine(1519)-N(6))-dimethyltransferase RsmA [Verrucomicrobia bacterium]|nr:16S rRNA (adenine(1518)-N(6)/adenine(1519)-N(6))-dimethyltransferase RsmA [Verrucomicrobiota bacterium]
MNLNEIRRLLTENNIKLTKSLGQNFLHDSNLLNKIIAAAQIHNGDQVLEIGPGLGPLTKALLDKGTRVLALETDSRLMRVLQHRLHNYKNLELVHVDAVDYLKRNRDSWRGWKLVSNLPYSAASVIIVELALSKSPPDRMVATLQMEVARRLSAKPDTEEYGLLTLLTRLQYSVTDYFKIPSTAFFPQPDVVSACVTMVRREKPLLPENYIEPFKEIVKLSFSQRRKQLVKLLKHKWPEQRVLEYLHAHGIRHDARAETLSAGQFAGLTESLVSASHRHDGI